MFSCEDGSRLGGEPVANEFSWRAFFGLSFFSVPQMLRTLGRSGRGANADAEQLELSADAQAEYEQLSETARSKTAALRQQLDSVSSEVTLRSVLCWRLSSQSSE